MSSASKSKSMANKTARAIKKHPQVSLNPSNVLSDGDGAAASACDPVLDALHTLNISQSAAFTVQKTNGQSRSIDDTEDHSLSPTCTANEYDFASNNNDSCSPESEDQKDKTSPNTSASRSDPISVPDLDADKREKIRLKNEKKHQRQRENRAKELHARCSGYLKSRRVEVLAQPLVLMGFPLQRAKMALILNECRMEESVAWLLQDNEEDNKQHTVTNVEDAVSHLKIDISGELARIEELERKYSCSKQEVERVVVSCEGDLEKAEDTFKAQKQEHEAASHPKMEECGNPSSTLNSKLVGVASDHIIPKARSQVKGIASQYQVMDERHHIYSESMLAQALLQESTNMNLQSRRTMQTHADWVRNLIAVAAEKRRSGTSFNPSISPPSGFSRHGFPMPVSKSQNIISPNFQLAMREPVKVMQRPQSGFNANQRLQSTSTSFIGSPPTPTGWYSNGIISSREMMGHSQPFDSSLMEFSKMSLTGQGMSVRNNNLQPASSSSSLLAAPSSLGLFSDWGALASSGKSSTIDWSTRGSLPQLDYASIDWSLDTSQLRPSTRDGVQLSDSTFLVRKATSTSTVDEGYFSGAQNTVHCRY